MYPTSFGIRPEDYDFGSDDTDYGTPPEGLSYFDRAQQALEMRRRVVGDLGSYGEKPPEPVSIPRVQKETQDSSLLALHPEAGKWLDLANQLGVVIANQKKKRYAKSHPGSRQNYSQIPAGVFNAKAKAIEEGKYKSQFEEGKANAQIAEAEARINDSAMNRYLGRRTAELGQMVPAMTRAALREPKAPRGPTALEQRLQEFDKFADENNMTPEQRTRAKGRILGAGDMRSAQEIAEQAAKAHVRLLELTDKYRTTNPKPGSSLDPSERNRQIAAKYVAELIYNDYEDPEKAAEMGVTMFRQLEGNLGAGAKTGILAPPPPASPQVAGLPPGVPMGGPVQQPGAAPAAPPIPRGMVRVKTDIGGLQPDLQAKLNVYAQIINRDPSRRAQLREALLREYHLDPDLYLDVGQ